MRLSKSQIQHISDLAQLNLSNEETAKFQKQLSSILEYIELLNEVDTSNVEPTAQTTGLKNVAKKDSPCGKSPLTQEEVLSNAAEKQDGYIKTKAVL